MHTLWQLVRRLLRRPPRYPITVTRVSKSGRRMSMTFPTPESVDNFFNTVNEELANPSSFLSPVTLEPHPDDDPRTDREHPRLLPPLAVQIAALRQRTLELAGLLDDDDEDQERDRKLLWWFRRQRDQAD